MTDKSSLLSQLKIDRSAPAAAARRPWTLWAGTGGVLVLLIASFLVLSDGDGVPVKVAVARAPTAGGGGGASLLDASVSVMIEALLLAGSGALIGAAVAWGIFNNRLFYTPGWGAFHMKMDLEVAGLAALIAVVVGGIAGLFPAIRAARAPIVMALQQR
ncbi:MAG: hypothetical protein LCH56_15250 [Proteobacteria bacterium]|nr:hypothetical protein [Pseudomonadota bacterium]